MSELYLGNQKNDRNVTLAVFRYLELRNLFPLDSCRWFAGNIVDDAVDVVNFIDDTG